MKVVVILFIVVIFNSEISQTRKSSRAFRKVGNHMSTKSRKRPEIGPKFIKRMCKPFCRRHRSGHVRNCVKMRRRYVGACFFCRRIIKCKLKSDGFFQAYQERRK